MKRDRASENLLQKLFRKIRAKKKRADRKRKANQKIRKAEVLIISYPKSGRTWLRVMLAQYIKRKENQKSDSLDLYEITRASDVFALSDFHHEQAHHLLLIPHQDLVFDTKKFKNKKVIFLYRDARDTAVSMYFQLTKREMVTQDKYYEGSMSDLLKDKYFGLEKVIRFNKMWLDNGHNCEGFLPLCYEDMRQDPGRYLGEVLMFLGEKSPDTALIDSVCEAARFENMKKNEMDSNFDHISLGARIPGDENSLKVRRGKIGGYRDYFTEDDHRFANSLMNQDAI